MIEMEADAVEGRLLQLFLLRAEVRLSQIAEGQLLVAVRGGAAYSGGLPRWNMKSSMLQPAGRRSGSDRAAGATPPSTP